MRISDWSSDVCSSDLGDGLALHRFEMGLEIPPLMDADAVAEMLADILAKLFRGDEEVGGAIVMDKGEGQGDRRMVDVLSAHIEGPGDRIEGGEDRRVGLLLLQPVGHFLPLGGRRFPCQLLGMDRSDEHPYELQSL